MSTLVGALVLFLVGLLGARFSFTWARAPLGPRTFLIAGTHFLLLGLVLGSEPVGLLTPAALRPLYPLLALGIGWIGLLYGLQLDFAHLRDLPRAAVRLALLQAIISFLLFALVATAVLRVAGPLSVAVAATVLAAAAVACVSSPLGIAVVADLARLRGRLSELLLIIATLDALVGILAMQLVYAVFHPLELRGGLAGWSWAGWIALALALGLSCGIIFVWLTRLNPARDELSLALLGTALFVAGAALFLGLSALFAAVVAGAVIANLSPGSARIFRALQRWEKPIYVILLVLMGALLEFDRWLILPLAAGYAGVRLASKLAGGWLASRLLPREQRPPAAFGLAFGAQSGMPLALVLSVALSYGALREGTPAPVRLMVSSIVVAVMAGELGGPVLTRSVLLRAGERAGALRVETRDA